MSWLIFSTTTLREKGVASRNPISSSADEDNVSPRRIKLLHEKLGKHIPKFSAGQDRLAQETDFGLMHGSQSHGTSQQEDDAEGLQPAVSKGRTAEKEAASSPIIRSGEGHRRQDPGAPGDNRKDWLPPIPPSSWAGLLKALKKV